jgi:hypothetical protein
MFAIIDIETCSGETSGQKYIGRVARDRPIISCTIYHKNEGFSSEMHSFFLLPVK